MPRKEIEYVLKLAQEGIDEISNGDYPNAKISFQGIAAIARAWMNEPQEPAE